MNTIGDAAVFDELGFTKQAQTTANSGELGQADFLTLMTTQLQNQDPFKPLESGDFLGQLAQFGAVSGIENLQVAFQGLANTLTSDQTLQAAGMVGREVLVPEKFATITAGGGISGAIELPDPVSNLTIGIYNSAGQQVRSIELGSTPSGMGVFNWDGLTTDGEAVPSGIYEVRAEAIRGGTNEAYDVMLAARVESVTLPRGGAPLTLELAGIGEVGFSDVVQIR